MQKYVTHQDKIQEFLPKSEVKMIILGTMASYMARALDNKDPESYFYYHSNLNRFWDVLTHLYYGEKRKLHTIEEKKAFLELAGIALSNLVSEASLREDERSDDSFLFEAYSEGRLTFKTITQEFRSNLQNVPVFFTCYRKKPIENLLQGFLKHNSLEHFSLEKIHFLHSPTRRSYEYIANLWRPAIDIKRAG